VLSHIGEINWSNENLASLCYSLAEGYIGAEAAHSLIGHMQATAKGMDPRSVLADPEGVEVKDEAELYGLIGSVVAVVSQSKAPRKKLMQEYFKWLKRLPDEHLVCGLRDMQIASKRIGNEEFFQLPIVHKWIKQNQAVFL
jgi:hypothetical protein